MSRIITLSLGLMLSMAAFAQDLSIQGFNNRFSLVRNDDGKVTAIKLKKVTTQFSVMPFIQQLKQDLLNEQESFVGLMESDREAEIDELLLDMGINPYNKSGEGAEEAQKLKEALLNIPNVDVEGTFNELAKRDFWKEFESKLKEAFLFADPTVLANLEDARFFYKRNVTYKVVNWALDQAKKRFSNVPVLSIASFVIIRVHDMMMEQRHFHHNMLLHYFETLPEDQLGMTKEEVDRAVSSIYEYKIDALNVPESNRAARDWLNYGMNNFYALVRQGNSKVRSWQGPLSSYSNVKKINFAFADVTEAGSRKIYHLHSNAHRFSSKPSLAYDFSSPARVKRNRALLNIGGIAVGFIPMPAWLKGNVDSFLKSFYIEQVRWEGALVGYFESTGEASMVSKIYQQRANFYIVQ